MFIIHFLVGKQVMHRIRCGKASNNSRHFR